MSSILNSIKKMLGLEADYTAFDTEVQIFINGALATLNQIGVGPDNGFQIEDHNDTWESFLGPDPRLNNIMTYVYLRVRLLFDPPPTSFAIDAIKGQITELEYRINVAREVAQWQDPSSVILVTD